MQKDKIVEEIKLKTNEVNKLISEINNLKRLLRNEDPNNTNVISEEEKIKIFMSFFRGRDTVYPYLSINKFDPSKKYYIPKCANEWKQGICNKTMGKKCRSCQYWSSLPLDKEVIRRHLFADSPIGIYPMLEDETCYFLALDFDDKKHEKDVKKDVLSFVEVCEQYNIPVLIERSRSGSGFHLWIFFEENIKASTARKLGSLLLSKVMNDFGNLKIDSFDRMFPNQNTLPSGGYGSLIALPLQKEPLKNGNTAFVDKNFNIINNQYEHLRSIKKLTYDDLRRIIEAISDDTEDISNREIDSEKKSTIQPGTHFDFPQELNVRLGNMIYIEKTILDAVTKNQIRRLATFANSEFFKKQRMRISVHNTPMLIDCSKEDERYLMLPRGRLEHLQELCKENNCKINLVDERNPGKLIKVKFEGKLTPEQDKAVNELLVYENGILEAPTGFGKTVLACKMIAERKVNTLIITEKLQILSQWKKSIKRFLNQETVGQIGGGEKIITNQIDVASIKSIWNHGHFIDIVRNYGMVIVDECHHLAAFTYESAVNEINAKYVYGLSATPTKENGHTPIIKMQCGDIRYKVDAKSFNASLNLPMKVIAKRSHLSFYNDGIKDYTITEIDNLISKDVIRSEFIINDIKKEFENGKNILVLTERLDHLRYLTKRLGETVSNVFSFHGGMSKKTLEEYKEKRDIIKKRRQNKIVVATGSYIGEGFDDASLDVLFLTMPVSGITRVTQYAGRLHRSNPEKQSILIYDYTDENFRITRSMFEKRKKIYQKMGYEIIDENNKNEQQQLMLL